jgi:hypothetical protein
MGVTTGTKFWKKLISVSKTKFERNYKFQFDHNTVKYIIVVRFSR